MACISPVLSVGWLWRWSLIIRLFTAKLQGEICETHSFGHVYQYLPASASNLLHLLRRLRTWVSPQNITEGCPEKAKVSDWSTLESHKYINVQDSWWDSSISHQVEVKQSEAGNAEQLIWWAMEVVITLLPFCSTKTSNLLCISLGRVASWLPQALNTLRQRPKKYHHLHTHLST